MSAGTQRTANREAEKPVPPDQRRETTPSIGPLGRYQVLERLGEGGLGAIFRARDTQYGRTVAVRVVPASLSADPVRRDRLRADARAVASLSHPGIATLFDVGESDAGLHLAFEYVPGKSLREIISGRPLNVRKAIDLAIQIADALDEAHARGLSHRDLRPDNIVVTPTGHAKILECGLAGWTRSGAAGRDVASRLEAGLEPDAGAAAYLSPEQVLGSPGDHQSDLFSLGAVLFEMLTGGPPFAAESATATALRVLQASPPALSRTIERVPGELDAVVGRLLAKSLETRYASASLVALDLRRVLAILDRAAAANASAIPAALPQDRSRSGLRRSTLWLVIAVALLTLTAMVTVMIW